MGETLFGVATVTYGASGTNLPSETGDYVATFTVEETDNYAGLVKEVSFTILPAEETGGGEEETGGGDEETGGGDEETGGGDEEETGGEEEPVAPDEFFAGTVDAQFPAKQEFLGVLRDAESNIVGTVTLKLRNASVRVRSKKTIAKASLVKISASAIVVSDGKAKSVAAKLVRIRSDEWGRQLAIEFKQPIGIMTLAPSGDGRFKLRNDRYEMVGLVVDGKTGAERDIEVGGDLPEGTMRFTTDMDVMPTLAGGFSFVESAFPTDAMVAVMDVRSSAVAKALSKTVRMEYVIKGIDAAKPSRLRLAYSPKTGLFKGSFRLYATTGGGRPRRRVFTVNVAGFVVDGEGVGKAAVKKSGVEWTVTLESR